MKTNVAPVPWTLTVGRGLTHFSVKFVYKGHDFGDAIWVCRGKRIYLCAGKQTRFSKLTNDLKKVLLKDPGHVLKIRERFEKQAVPFLGFVHFLKNANLSTFSDKKLLEAYNSIFKEYDELYLYGEPIAFGSKPFADMLEEWFLKNKRGTSADFHALITPSERTFLQKEHQALLSIALHAKEKPAAGIKELVRKHTEQFTWIPFDYGSIHYTEKHFMQELKKLLKKSNQQLEQELSNMRTYSSKTKQTYNHLIKKYSIDAKRRKMLEAVQHSNYLMDYKKEVFTMLHWYSFKVFREIAKRLGMPRTLVQYVMPDEMKELLLGKEKPNLKKLESRHKHLVLISKPSGKIEIIEGAKAKSIVESFLKKHNEEEAVPEFSGRPAFYGRVTGKVRVITDAKKCHEIKKGEIMITVMTSPDFMVAVKKAAAIVTDEGGVTCHAAIVSRERKIPCIVGTHKATRVLKTGMIIEVNADEGVVKILK